MINSRKNPEIGVFSKARCSHLQFKLFLVVIMKRFLSSDDKDDCSLLQKGTVNMNQELKLN